MLEETFRYLNVHQANVLCWSLRLFKALLNNNNKLLLFTLYIIITTVGHVSRPTTLCKILYTGVPDKYRSS